MITEIKKGIYVSSLIGRFVGAGYLAKNLISDENSRISFYTQATSDSSRKVLNKLNFEVEVVGFDKELMSKKNFLIVSNHMSYFDILVMSSVLPCVFVTSVDMGESGFLGTLAELGGSIFVERRNRTQIDRDLASMTKALKDGFNVLIYPEGTSTNGQRVLPFKKSLLMSAVQSNRDIMPVCLKYLEIDGEEFNEKNADKICWYGEMKFLGHLLGAFKFNSVKVRLEFLKPIEVKPDSTRDELAKVAFESIDSVYSK